ncbi:MAG TPA: N-acetyl-alpha-D-glucosaminyl L-malate synthase BshA [Polyangia bacterium]|nr:N-acetyl-alpha-D-glucosaminyl L-malate synthase BshA [Polyangia bacterium]
MTRGADQPPLRVGVVCFSTFGGSGVVAAEVGMALAERGHTVHVFSDDVPGRLDPAQPRVCFHPVRPAAYPQLKQSPYPLALASKIVDVARRNGLDVIHAHYALPHAASAYLACAVLGGDRNAARPRLVTTLHGTDITLVGSDASFLPLTQFSITASDAVTAPSAWLAAATFQTLEIPASVQIDVIPNFVDADRFSPGPPSNRATPVLLHVSNFRPVKRVGDVVAVFAALRAERPVRLRLVGDGPDRPRLEAEVAARGLAADVDFLGEQIDLPAVMRDADLVVLPSETESFGLAALEAMSCGVPVIASAVGGVGEVVADGETGALCPMGDVAAMAAAARRLLDDAPLRARFAAAARHRAATQFRRDPAVDRYLDVYRRVLR